MGKGRSDSGRSLPGRSREAPFRDLLASHLQAAMAAVPHHMGTRERGLLLGRQRPRGGCSNGGAEDTAH